MAENWLGKRERLEALYGVTAIAAGATTLEGAPRVRPQHAAPTASPCVGPTRQTSATYCSRQRGFRGMTDAERWRMLLRRAGAPLDRCARRLGPRDQSEAAAALEAPRAAACQLPSVSTTGDDGRSRPFLSQPLSGRGTLAVWRLSSRTWPPPWRTFGLNALEAAVCLSRAATARKLPLPRRLSS